MRLMDELMLLGAFDKAELSPSAKKHKKEYDTKYESTPARKKYRRELEAERRKRGVDGKGGKDMSHTVRGTIVPEDMHANRARHFKSKGTLKKIYAPDDRPKKKAGEDDDTPPPAKRRTDSGAEYEELMEDRDHPIFNVPIEFDEQGNPIPPKYKPQDIDIGRNCRFECGGAQVHRQDGAIGCTNSWCAANTPEAMMESSEGRPQGEQEWTTSRKVGDVFATRADVERVDPNPPEDSLEAKVARMANRPNAPKQDPYYRFSFKDGDVSQRLDAQGNPPSNYAGMSHPDLRTGEPMDIAMRLLKNAPDDFERRRKEDMMRSFEEAMKRAPKVISHKPRRPNLDYLQQQPHAAKVTPTEYDIEGNPIAGNRQIGDIGGNCPHCDEGKTIYMNDGAIGCSTEDCVANTSSAMESSDDMGTPHYKRRDDFEEKQVGMVYPTQVREEERKKPPGGIAGLFPMEPDPDFEPHVRITAASPQPVRQLVDAQGNPPTTMQGMRHRDIRTGEPMDLAFDVIEKNLNRWFKEKWVDVSRTGKDGKHPPCGRSKAKTSSKGYPKCRPSVKVSSKTPKTSGSMTSGQKRAATKRKRSKKQGVGGKPTIVKILKNEDPNQKRLFVQGQKTLDGQPAFSPTDFAAQQQRREAAKKEAEAKQARANAQIAHEAMTNEERNAAFQAKQARAKEARKANRKRVAVKNKMPIGYFKPREEE